jgi:hypothetical protein
LAQDLQLLGKLSETDYSVTRVMLTAKCDLGWLSKVVADSNLPPTTLRKLPTGQEIFFSGSCEAQPPVEVLAQSKILLRLDRSYGQSRAPKVEVNKLHQELTMKTAEYDRVFTKNNQLNSQVKALETELAQARKELETEIKLAKGFNTSSLVSFLFLGVQLTGFGMYFGYKRKRDINRNINNVRPDSNDLVFPKTWNLKESDKDYTFSFFRAEETSQGSGTFVGKYKCPCCSERNVTGRDQNLRKHIQTHLEKKPSQKEVTTEIRPDSRIFYEFQSEERVSA